MEPIGSGTRRDGVVVVIVVTRQRRERHHCFGVTPPVVARSGGWAQKWRGSSLLAVNLFFT